MSILAGPYISKMNAGVMLLFFVAGYLAIALERQLKVNKAASALITGVVCWTIYFMQSPSPENAGELLMRHLGNISSIIFFLFGAMAIVELIDTHNGFDVITDRIKTSGKATLLFIITFLTFFLSAFLDNLTAAIVMASLCAKLLPDREDRLWFSGMIVIAANSGGAWSPLGDVTMKSFQSPKPCRKSILPAYCSSWVFCWLYLRLNRVGRLRHSPVSWVIYLRMITLSAVPWA